MTGRSYWVWATIAGLSMTPNLIELKPKFKEQGWL
jgi:hypothetical protein